MIRYSGIARKRRRNHIGHQRRIAQHPALPQTHPSNREARQRTDDEGQEHRHQADKEAVAELVPEACEVPKVLCHHDLEGLQ